MAGLPDGENTYICKPFRQNTGVDTRTDRRTSCYDVVGAMYVRRTIKNDLPASAIAAASYRR